MAENAIGPMYYPILFCPVGPYANSSCFIEASERPAEKRVLVPERYLLCPLSLPRGFHPGHVRLASTRSPNLQVPFSSPGKYF